MKRVNPLSGRLIALLDGPAPLFPCAGSGFCITFGFSSCDSNFNSSLQRDPAPYVLDCSIDLFPLNLLPIARKIRRCRPYTFSNIVLMSSSYRLRQPKCTKHCHWASCWGVSRETTLIKKVISLFGRGYQIRGERASWTPNFHWFNWNEWFNRYFNNINRWSWYRTEGAAYDFEAVGYACLFFPLCTSGARSGEESQ